MEVYRIALARFATALISPGSQGRWNGQGSYVIYTAGSRALSCLENLVHRDCEGLQQLFKVMIVQIPAQVSIEKIDIQLLPPDWTDYKNQHASRQLGNAWLRGFSSCVLQVPSAIIPHEFNYLLNPAHPEFQLISIAAVEDFSFDNRLKGEKPAAG
jgi:RES domain-containing protein